METLKARLKALEDLKESSAEVLFHNINALAMKSSSDFDKYEAVKLAENLVSCAPHAHHKKFTYYSVTLQKIHQRLHKSNEQFKAYFPARLWERFAVPGQG